MVLIRPRHIVRLGGHSGPINALTYSSGHGQYLLSGSSDKTINLYNPSKGSLDGSSTSEALVQSYTGAHGYEVLSLAVAADNARFASSGVDKTVFLWDVATCQTTRRFGGSSGHSGRVECVAFGGDGDSIVVSGSFDSTVRLWDTKSQSHKPLMTLNEAKDSVSCIAVCEHEIITGSVDGRLRVYDIRAGICSVDLVGHPLTSITLTRQADSVLVSSLDSRIRLFDKLNGKLLQTFTAPEYVNTTYRLRSTLGFSDALALSGSENGFIYLWDVLSGEVRDRSKHQFHTQAALKPSRSTVSALDFKNSTSEWATGGGDGTIVVWGHEN